VASFVLVRAHVDNARYWGKRDTSLILPTNSSLSVTLDQDHLRSTTTSRADAGFEKGDRLWLNGTEENIKQGGRLAVCIKELRGWRREMEEKDGGLPKVRLRRIWSSGIRHNTPRPEGME
jgi:diphosphomevalonate decarboxylase